MVWQRLDRRNSNKRSFCARATYRLYIQYSWRRMGLLRQRNGCIPVRRLIVETYRSGRKTKRSILPNLRLLGYWYPIHSLSGEYRDGDRYFSNSWYSIAFLQLWWLRLVGIHYPAIYFHQTRQRPVILLSTLLYQQQDRCYQKNDKGIDIFSFHNFSIAHKKTRNFSRVIFVSLYQLFTFLDLSTPAILFLVMLFIFISESTFTASSI